MLFCPKHADEALWRRYCFSCKCRTCVDTSGRCYSGLLSDRERRTRFRSMGDPVELRVHGFLLFLFYLFVLHVCGYHRLPSGRD